jgi:hypothetical protein
LTGDRIDPGEEVLFMASIEKLEKSLRGCKVDPAVIERILGDPRGFTEKRRKDATAEDDRRRVAILVKAMATMDRELDFHTRSEVRAMCSCSTHGWREKAVKQIAKDLAGGTLEERLQALGKVKYMGSPVRNADGTITGGVGTSGGFPCPCPVFKKWPYEEPVSTTYCMCCGGHFRHHYQIALGVKLRLKAVDSSVLESMKKKPCRFTFEIVG